MMMDKSVKGNESKHQRETRKNVRYEQVFYFIKMRADHSVGLQHLFLSENNLCDIGVKVLSRFKLMHLQSLDLVENNLTGLHLRELHLPELHEMQLDGNRISGEQMKKIRMGYWMKTKSFFLNNNEIMRDGAMNFLVMDCRLVEELHLSNNRIVESRKLKAMLFSQLKEGAYLWIGG